MKNRNLKEYGQHGNVLMGIGVYDTVGPLGDELPLYMHWHNELEIFSLITGKLQLRINDKTIIAEEGDIVVIPPGSVHGSDESFGMPFRFRAILIQYEFIAGMIHDIIARKYIQPFFTQNNSCLVIKKNAEHSPCTFQYIQEIAHQFSQKRDGYELLIKALTYQIFYELYQFQKLQTKELTAETEIKDVQKNIVEKEIIQYINEHFQQQILLKDISSIFFMSESYFCRYFKKHFHITFSEYLSHVRLRAAEQLLLHTDYGMERIAAETGFSSACYLTVCFKREYQLTPTKYREKFQSENL